MANKKPTILVTDDEKSIRNSLSEILEFEQYNVLQAEGGETALQQIRESKVDLVILDIKMKGMDGIEVLENIRETHPDLPVIMISGHGTIKIAVQATKIGAFDFIEKPPDLNRLLISVRNALSRNELVEENKRIRSELNNVKEMVGESPAIARIKKTIEKVAPSTSRILITGENGTGKELVARWIHEKSKRASKKFVDVNCAAIPSELLESELFGHEKGAFTGASDRRIGKFEQADGGTLFLDEIGDMSPDAQAKVLRVLQENQITRVGGNERIDVDVRVICATNRDLEEEIRENRFREDLYHRINVIPIKLPPLRERKDDIPLLARWFLSQLSDKEIIYAGKSFTDDALEELKSHQWSGNIRELQNAVERMALLSDGESIDRDDVTHLGSMKTGTKSDLKELAEQSLSFQEYKEQAERYYLLNKLEEHDWNVSATADAIDIQRSHIYNKMKKYDIER
ncbi:sigma-54-dependent Fis family transcriptional regulator [Rhodohalobacter sp. SW132]|uniref:sigma-54-dependent transcriptional regulator n=1 Tax=Rhodohalobacter sp. SW132 TaxID=2293433 RepID=UPI000E24722F|nr:sigma-54 dependent transcriptional regulator [Rhodohalobacter sp. SW132]REL38276.1 sigma-54-dependent Fis family transcriptional regulator [Rhodohalobacter sp. SW132]